MNRNRKPVAAVIALTGILILLSLTVFSSIAFAVDENNAADGFVLPGFTKVAESDFLVLYVNYENTEIAVRDRDSGTVWYSNPPDRSRVERVARGANKDKLNALFTLGYYTPGDRLIQINSYNDSVVYGQFSFELVPQGIKVNYLLGKEWEDDAYIPVMVEASLFEAEILSLIDKKADQNFILDCYQLVVLEPVLEDYERVTIFNVDKEAIFGDYTLNLVGQQLSGINKRRFLEAFLDQIAKVNKLRDRSQVRREHIPTQLQQPTYVLRSDLLVWDYEDLGILLKSLDYEPEKVQAHHIAYGIAPPVRNEIVFEVSIIYQLDEDTLVVSVPASEISFPTNVRGETGLENYPVYQLDLLEYFGAIDINHEGGYIFVPDGTGALIYANNGKLAANPYDVHVYGVDQSLEITESLPNTGEQIYLPVFGITTGEAGLFAIIENGESLARIRADIAGRIGSYNLTYPRFTIIPKAEAQLEGNVPSGIRITRMNIYQAQQYQGDFRVRYKFLTGQDANYVGMARYYQDYLIKRSILTRSLQPEQVPFVVELVGGIQVKESILGIPINVTIPMTRYDQAVGIVEKLKSENIDHVYLKYTGWLRGGINHGFPKNVELDAKLGGGGDFNELVSRLKEMAVEFYPEVSFLNAYPSAWARFFNSNLLATTLTRETAVIHRYDVVTGQIVRGYERYIVNPAKLPVLIGGFTADCRDRGIENIAFRYVGNQLNSNFQDKVQQLIDREQARDIITGELGRLKAEGMSIMVNGGHLYTLPYADLVLNLPDGSSGNMITDQAVPFYQMVVHGYIPYAYRPINLSDSVDDVRLKLIETGALPYYYWTYQPSSLSKNTEFDYLYSTHYQSSLDQALDLYKEIKPLLEQILAARIIDHKQLMPNVYQTTYENGVVAVVNYNKFAVEIFGQQIGAKEYLIEVR